MSQNNMPGVPFRQGTLQNTNPLVVDMAGAPLPCTATLNSTDAGRKIELSSDGGVTYFQPTYDATTTPMINVAIRATVTHARFTGANGNTWRLQ